MLIAFEGGEGSGKGTQIRLLEQSLKSRGIDVLSVIEPGETAVGKAIRKILLDRKNLRILGITEALLFFAARAQDIRITRHALEKGTVVLSDRSFYSTYAYSCGARGVSEILIDTLTEFVVEDTVPDLVILLDIPPELGLARKKTQKEMNRLDKEKLDFHTSVRKTYLDLAKRDPELWKVVDATQGVDEIHFEVETIVLKALRI
ncbi:dTMP kinase [candidate division WWE3 bacterium RIFOXYC2_FULL_42_13]|nr:MAG: dTMP kinase [candidate division WWE3 bacterium RIFOXYA2_FULL_43_12]OGC72149.1 MAG: dTMP kinase [candidate division WWE3 bacterium RIFOXYB2_FULL_43_9]OGC73223.1 MAG: dTMP kinase [candidate division WWE3 bacterium RIFOXYC2_FULL_42_13]OGC75578.1 MAG: dTMP kinase [candidate division WWE3 bacterium RIFOXYD2_FULL_43_10]